MINSYRPGGRASAVASAYTSLGIRKPAWMTDAAHRVEQALTAEMPALRPATETQLVAAVVAALANGTMPTDDEHVQHLAVHHILSAMNYGIDQQRRTLPGAWFDTAVTEHTTDVLKALYKPFAAAVQQLNGEGVSSDGTSAARAQVTTAANAWAAVFQLNHGKISQANQALVYAHLSLSQMDALEARTLTLSDIPVSQLALPADFDEYRQRVRSVDEQREQQAERERQLAREGRSVNPGRDANGQPISLSLSGDPDPAGWSR